MPQLELSIWLLNLLLNWFFLLILFLMLNKYNFLQKSTYMNSINLKNNKMKWKWK